MTLKVFTARFAGVCKGGFSSARSCLRVPRGHRSSRQFRAHVRDDCFCPLPECRPVCDSPLETEDLVERGLHAIHGYGACEGERAVTGQREAGEGAAQANAVLPLSTVPTNTFNCLIASRLPTLSVAAYDREVMPAAEPVGTVAVRGRSSRQDALSPLVPRLDPAFEYGELLLIRYRLPPAYPGLVEPPTGAQATQAPRLTLADAPAHLPRASGEQGPRPGGQGNIASPSPANAQAGARWISSLSRCRSR